MARPNRCRRVCAQPRFDRFAPCGEQEQDCVLLTVDEYEVLRLVDLEGRTHEDSAALMGISRTTVTEIYQRARFKLADCLVNGKGLRIAGGNYQLCDGSMGHRCGKRCRKAEERASKQKGTNTMKIAVTYENGQVFPHFGHTAQFKVYQVDNGAVTGQEVISTNGSGHGALAGLLAGLGVDTLICGGIGAGAQAALAQAGVRLFGGVSGDADQAVRDLLAGTLAFDAQVHCDHHHEHQEGHDCGHSCGEDKHGCSGRA